MTGVAYPSVRLPRLNAVSPVSVSEFNALAGPVAQWLGADVYLPPGTELGPLTGEMGRQPRDVDWLNSWTLLMSDRALAHFSGRGIELKSVAADLRRRRDRGPWATVLYELEIPAVAGVTAGAHRNPTLRRVWLSENAHA